MIGIKELTTYAEKLPAHVRLKCDLWTIATFRADDISFRPRHFLDDFDTWSDEFQTKPTTTCKPKFITQNNNVLALTGLTESAKRDTAETSTTVRYLGIGTGTTAESESQTALITEMSGGGYARKDLSSTGQRAVTNQTARYGDTFTDAQVGATVPVTFYEAGLFTASSSGIMHARVLHDAAQVDVGDLYTVQLTDMQVNGVL